MSPDRESGRYRLERLLDPDGAAWLAEDLEDPGRQVVIKMLPDGSDVIAARHLVSSLADVNEPGLLVPTDEGETPEGRAFLVYPFVEGLTLRESLNTSGPLGFPRAGAVLRQIGDAVAVLHARGMLHGSLAPEHIMVQHAHGRDHVILLNAGAFRVTASTTASPAYLAPEQLAGEPVPKSDVFSVAALAAEIITGRRAFRYGSLTELAHIQKRGIPRGAFRKLRPKLPVRAEDELRRALAWDPGQRPAEVQILTARLAEYLGADRRFPTRRVALLGGVALAAIATRVRGCRKRWGR